MKLEAAGSSVEALAFYRKAAQYSPQDEDLRKELWDKIDALEKKFPDSTAYRSMKKVPKPEGRGQQDRGYNPYSR